MSDHKEITTGFDHHDNLINELTELCSTFEHSGLIKHILTLVVELGLNKTENVDLKLLKSSIAELKKGFEVFSPYRSVRKVTIFGSAQSEENSPEYEMAVEFCKQMVEKKFMIITGAGPGVMEAGNKGAGRDNSFGVNIKLPFEQASNKYIENDPKLITLKYFFTRKLMFIRESHATVVFPGGFGTLNEAIENITLFQTGKCAPRPIILLEPESFKFWRHWFTVIKRSLLKYDYIDKDDLNLFYYETSVESAVKRIMDFYKVYHSIRRIKGQTVLRLNHSISEEKLDYIREEFKDIILDNRIEQTSALPEEVQRCEYVDLPRLVFRFDEQKHGRLLEMINLLNGDV